MSDKGRNEAESAFLMGELLWQVDDPAGAEAAL